MIFEQRVPFVLTLVCAPNRYMIEDQFGRQDLLLYNLTILFINLIGLALIARLITPSYALARTASPILLCLALYCLEHFVGLGNLSWLKFPLTSGALVLIWKERAVLRANWLVEVVFAAAFALALIYGLAVANIDYYSERLTDLTFIRSFLMGERLPPRDLWLPPYRLDMYYGFQFYGAALLGRISASTSAAGGPAEPVPDHRYDRAWRGQCCVSLQRTQPTLGACRSRVRLRERRGHDNRAFDDRGTWGLPMECASLVTWQRQSA